MFQSKAKPAQQSLWIPTEALPDKSGQAVAMGFPEQVRALCLPFYDQRGRGRPGIDPLVYFKMLMIGFFENLSSEPRSTAGRGKKLGIDASTLEANASMRTLEQRLSGESYTAYVRALAAEAGVDAEDEAAVRRFDRKRKNKRLSNDEWHNPHDADAKIGKTKQGTTKLIYKVEHVVDLETGAIVDVDVLPGNQGDPALPRGGEPRRMAGRAAVDEQTIEGEQTTIESITAERGLLRYGAVAASSGIWHRDRGAGSHRE